MVNRTKIEALVKLLTEHYRSPAKVTIEFYYTLEGVRMIYSVIVNDVEKTWTDADEMYNHYLEEVSNKLKKLKEAVNTIQSNPEN
jgi:hypothetical protein